VGRFHEEEELALGALMIFLWTSFLQASTKNESVRKFITRAWPHIVYDNIVRKSIPESYFLCCQHLYLDQSFWIPLSSIF
jgi:hypothetical protein